MISSSSGESQIGEKEDRGGLVSTHALVIPQECISATYMFGANHCPTWREGGDPVVVQWFESFAVEVQRPL